MKFEVTKRQKEFIDAENFEVLFGGAAGGGKSFAQVLDAVYFALRFPKSRQLILRKTMPELEATLIQTLLGNYPLHWYNYNVTRRTATFVNGSVIRFGYCRNRNDVYRYQSAEFDIIRFDELTHFSEREYSYLISRVRGANAYPKQIKSASNPGGAGHTWVKQRFIDIGPPGIVHDCPGGTRVFLPSTIDDNIFLKKLDPGYKRRLENLAESDKRALLYGEWDIAEGRYFDEWNRDIHVVKPFEIPEHWTRFFAMDYGLDMLAGYWIAMDTNGRAYVYREIYEDNLIISEAAGHISAMCAEPVRDFIAPPDLWNRRQEQGKSAAEIFLENGIMLTKAPANRVAGWLELKEWLKPVASETGAGTTARLVFFDNCVNAIRTVPALMRDAVNPNDCATRPHEYTHAPDAIRYFVASRPAEQSAAGTQSEETNQIENLLKY